MTPELEPAADRAARHSVERLVRSLHSSPGANTSRKGPRNLRSGDQSVMANTTFVNAPLKSFLKAWRKSMAVRWASLPKAPQPQLSGCSHFNGIKAGKHLKHSGDPHMTER